MNYTDIILLLAMGVTNESDPAPSMILKQAELVANDCNGATVRYTGGWNSSPESTNITRESYAVYPTMFLFRPLRRTSSNRLSTAVQSLPIPFLYASSTAKNIGSESGCVDTNARSST